MESNFEDNTVVNNVLNFNNCTFTTYRAPATFSNSQFAINNRGHNTIINLTGKNNFINNIYYIDEVILDDSITTIKNVFNDTTVINGTFNSSKAYCYLGNDVLVYDLKLSN